MALTDDMKKITFDHEKKLTNESMGISRERTVKLGAIIQQALSQAEKETDTITRVIELLITNKSMTEVEKIYTVFCLGRFIGEKDGQYPIESDKTKN